MQITRWLANLEKAMLEALTTFFALMGDGESPEFWHEREDLKMVPIPVRRQEQDSRYHR